jgi:hypothetical protein
VEFDLFANASAHPTSSQPEFFQTSSEQIVGQPGTQIIKFFENFAEAPIWSEIIPMEERELRELHLSLLVQGYIAQKFRYFAKFDGIPEWRFDDSQAQKVVQSVMQSANKFIPPEHTAELGAWLKELLKHCSFEKLKKGELAGFLSLPSSISD